jgi:hypothetical protein
MKTALFTLIVCAALDVVGCGLVLVVVCAEHRRVRREAALSGETVPSASGQFGCLVALGLLGLAILYGSGWLLLR